MVVYKGVCHPTLCDVMGHMTTRHYIAMFDDGSYHFLHALFGWSGEQASIDKKGWADVRHIIDYQAEVAVGDLLEIDAQLVKVCLLYTSPSPRDGLLSRMPSSA